MFGGRNTAGPSPRPESLLTYISWYINGYGRSWTPLDVNPKMRPVYGQFAGSEGVLLAATEQKAFLGNMWGRPGRDHTCGTLLPNSLVVPVMPRG
jgi:hypothetical protein